MFQKEKRDGSVKCGTCADGRNQRETAEPDAAAASHTLALESVPIIMATIGAF
jgi:hypothetical protein